MAGVSVKIIKNDLPAIAKNLPIRRRVVMQRRGEQMVEIAKQRSRFDTGEMQAGWVWIETNDGGRLENDVAHTAPNEYGHVTPNGGFVPAQPMARPAAEQVFPLIIADFSEDSMWLP